MMMMMMMMMVMMMMMMMMMICALAERKYLKRKQRNAVETAILERDEIRISYISQMSNSTLCTLSMAFQFKEACHLFSQTIP